MNGYMCLKLSRFIGAAALLSLLAFCSFLSVPEGIQTVSVPLSCVTLQEEQFTAGGTEEIRNRLRGERERELTLLESVAGNPQTTQETRQSALDQAASLAVRMEKEAEIEAALAYMGFLNTAVVCGAQQITVYAPAGDAADEKNRIRMIDAAASHGGAVPGDVQIILAKK